MLRALDQKLKTTRTWPFVLITVIGSELVTTFMNTTLSLVWWGRVSPDLLIIGSIDGLVVPLVVAPIAIYLVRRAANLEEINEELERQITERQRTEAALREERALLAQRVEERTAELRAANVELARAAQLKDEFLANMSHELRTPLHAILGLSESLQEGTYGQINARQLAPLRTIEESGQHLLELITDILDVSKIGAGKVELRWAPVSVEAVCQASLQFVREAAGKKRLVISCSQDGTVTQLCADARRLKQILVNLLSNAVKFTPEGGAIGLDVVGDAARQRACFTVWDTGIGIVPEDVQRLFQPFVQLDGSLARRYSGTGLGLALVRQLAELHGGSVSVESEGLSGKGCRFTVSLPWQAERETGQQEEQAQEPVLSIPTPGRSAKVLVAEDNESTLGLMAD